MNVVKYASLMVMIFINHIAIGQSDELVMTTKYPDSQVVNDILQFEGIEYLEITFNGAELADKKYHLTVKEIWGGKIISDSTVINSEEMPFEELRTINDFIFSIRVISKLIDHKLLKMTFKLPRYSFAEKFKAIDTGDYSFRNIGD